MISFDKFLNTIKSTVFPSGISEDQAQLLAKLDPHKIYIENVRSLLGISHANAERILETAVRQGVFQRRIEVILPDGQVAASADKEDCLPETVHYWKNMGDFHEEFDLPTKSLAKTVFYQLDEHDSQPHTRAT